MNPSKRLFLLPWSTALFVLLAGLLLFSPAAAEEDQEQLPLAPKFSLKNLEGQRVALDDLLGRGPLLIDFWATWCKPCIKELPHLHDLFLKYRDRGFQVVAISEDSPRSLSKVKSFVAGNKYEFLVLLDENGAVQRKFNFRALPYTVLLDRDGHVIYSRMGYRPGDEQVLEEKLLALLAAEEAVEEGADQSVGNEEGSEQPAESEESAGQTSEPPAGAGEEDPEDQDKDEAAGAGTAKAEHGQQDYIKKVKGEEARKVRAEEDDE